MTTTAKNLSSSLPAARQVPAVRAVPSALPRRARWAWLQLVRESLGGALLLAAWIALWTVTWAAVAGPLSPSSAAGSARAEVSSVERP